MADLVQIQSNVAKELVVIASPAVSDFDLIYAAGGGKIFGNSLQPDTVFGGLWYHGGNPRLSLGDTPIYKKCDKVQIVNETVNVISPKITRGLFTYSNSTNSDKESDVQYFWDEIYTSPLGFHKVLASGSNTYQFSVVGNTIILRTTDVNIIPKKGDYLVLTRLSDNQLTELDDSLKGYEHPVILSQEVKATAEATIGTLTAVGTDYTLSIGGTDLTVYTVADNDSTDDIAYNLAFNINNGNSGYTASVTNSTITITAPSGAGASVNGTELLVTFDGGTSGGNFSGGADTIFADSSVVADFSDGYSNMPLFFNSVNYQLKITDTTYSGTGLLTEYVLTCDKSINVTVDEVYGIVLLNRENTSLQKELFYDTFQQIEVNRDQLLGDPYFNTSLASQQGRKNFLNYNSSQFLGMRNLLLNVVNSNNQPFIETPFIIYDISEEVKDRFLPQKSSIDNLNFELHLPTILLQENTGTEKMINILTNYGDVQTETDGVGRYSELYLKWKSLTGKRYGVIFYDLRIVVIDDPELATALMYNSNRNFTLPEPIFNSIGNSTPNKTTNVDLDIVGIVNNAGGVVIIVNGNHRLDTGTAITISDAKVKVMGTNQIQAASANGIRYIKRYYDNPINSTGERADRFYIYYDSSLNSAVTGNGEFLNNGIGSSGKVNGATLSFNYFYTYRIKNSNYSSILPYSQIKSFNWATSIADNSINNVSGSLFIKIPEFTFQQGIHTIDGNSFLQDGFDVTDLELIIGAWQTDISKPFVITGLTNIVCISVQDTSTTSLPQCADLDIILTKSIYDAFVTRIGNNAGAYDYTLNNDGDPSYDILNNMKHYNITNGTLSPTLNTAEGKWTLGNISYQSEVDQFRTKIQVMVGANEWNDTMNPSYDSTNEFISEKYISEVAICSSDSDTPLVYTKISPPIKKTPDLDCLISMTIDF